MTHQFASVLKGSPVELFNPTASHACFQSWISPVKSPSAIINIESYASYLAFINTLSLEASTVEQKLMWDYKSYDVEVPALNTRFATT